MRNYGSKIKQTALAVSLAALAAGTTARADYSNTLSSFKPAGYWRLNEPTQLSVPTYPMTNIGAAGAALNGLYYGVPSLGQPGALASDADPAAQFQSTDQYAEVPYSAALNPSTSFTVEFWAKRTNSLTATASVICNFGPGRSNGYLVFAGNGDLQWTFRTYNGTTRGNLISTAAIVQDQWTHVVCVHDGTGVGANYIYLDGVLDSSVTPAPYVPQAISPMRIGIGPNNEAVAWPFPGLLDDVAIYHTALTAAQVAAHYAAGTNPSPPTPYKTLVQTTDAATAYWRLNEPALPPFSPYPATNSGSLGRDWDGVYSTLGGTTSGVAGPVHGQVAGFEANNRAVGMDGVSSQVSIPALTTLNTDTVTMACWFKRQGNQAGAAGLLFTRGNATGLTFDSANGLSYTWNNNYWGWGSGLATPDGVWTFAAMVVTPTNAVLYMGSPNGLTSATNIASHNAHDFSDAPLYLGYDSYSSTRRLKGTLDEAAIFDYALDYASISNLFYSATPALLLVNRTPADPVYEGMTVTFTASAVDSAKLSYQWRKNGGNLTGKTNAVLTLANVGTSASGNYDVVVTSARGTVTSTLQPLTVSAGPPVIFQAPQSLTRYAGGTATFSVVAGGSAPLSYQWTNNAGVIAGATNANYSIAAVTAANAGTYGVRLANPYGTTNSVAAVLTVLPVTNYAAVVMAGGPLAYWRFDETSGTTAFDWAGEYHGTNYGGVVEGTPGPQPPTYAGFASSNPSFEFNGTSSYVQPPPQLDLNPNALTISAWLKVTAFGTDWDAIVTKGDSSWRLHRNANTDVIGFGTSGLSNVDLRGNRSINDGQWHYVVAVYTGTAKLIYVDGTLDVSVGVTGTLSPNTFPVRIGDNSERPGRVWNGNIDEVALYNHALSAEEIANLYYVASAGPTAPTFTVLPQSRSTYVGGKAKFSALVNGSVPFTYQWLHAGTNLPGATLSSLTISNVSSAAAGSYVLRVTNPLGTTNSPAATLTVVTPGAGTYPALAIASSPVGYWRLNEPTDSLIAFDWFGASDATVEAGINMGVDGVRPPDNRGFEAGNLAAQFDGYTPASVLIPPQNVTLNHATFACWIKRNGEQPGRAGIIIQRSVGGGVKCTGLSFYDSSNANQLSYSWNDDYNAYHWTPGFTVPDQEWTFVAVSVTPTNATLYMGTSNGLVSAVNAIAHAVHDFGGAAIDLGRDNYQTTRGLNGTLDEVTFHAQALSPDQIATLFASGRYAPTDLPVISQQPASREVLVGQSAAFTITASGGVPWTYQWRHAGTAIAGATNATYAIPSAYYTDAGNYQAVVKNAGGSVTSAVATLTVRPPPSYANLTNDLVLHLRFDGNYLDTSGRANNGTPVGTLPGPTFVAGKIGSNAVHVDLYIDFHLPCLAAIQGGRWSLPPPCRGREAARARSY